MGFLQNDTNDIVVDAVLTDAGRKFLAKNDGSFSIIKFALGDDEIDYGIIRRYGRTVGKEKIEKNTGVFEALTNHEFAQKFKLISVSNPNLIRLPSLSLVGTGLTSNVLTMNRTSIKSRTLTISQTVQDEDTIDVELRDQSFVVTLSHMFLGVKGFIPDYIDNAQRATYTLVRDPVETSLGGSQLTFTLVLRTITDSAFTIYGATGDKTLIRTYVKIAGLQSGAVKEFEVQISK